MFLVLTESPGSHVVDQVVLSKKQAILIQGKKQWIIPADDVVVIVHEAKAGQFGMEELVAALKDGRP